MANVISRAVLRHHAALAKAGGVESVLIWQAEDLALTVIPLGYEHDPTDAGGETFSERIVNWGIAADEIVFPTAGKVEPAIGLEIRVDDKRYRVVANETGRCFDVMDSLGLLYRVHTVFKGDVISE